MADRQCRKIVCATVRQLPEGGRGEMANGNGERNHKQIGDTVLKATGDKQGDGKIMATILSHNERPQ